MNIENNPSIRAAQEIDSSFQEPIRLTRCLQKAQSCDYSLLTAFYKGYHIQHLNVFEQRLAHIGAYILGRSFSKLAKEHIVNLTFLSKKIQAIEPVEDALKLTTQSSILKAEYNRLLGNRLFPTEKDAKNPNFKKSTLPPPYPTIAIDETFSESRTQRAIRQAPLELNQDLACGLGAVSLGAVLIPITAIAVKRFMDK
ncbi:MAG: hypothetical protein JSS09_09020 [Verrucomicrobia bacterium]|nr:hypothetical protein [Verrucomicrobiota bacterium]